MYVNAYAFELNQQLITIGLNFSFCDLLTDDFATLRILLSVILAHMLYITASIDLDK